MLCISAAYAVVRCLFVCPSVCVSVTFMNFVKTNKHIIRSVSCGLRDVAVMQRHVYQRQIHSLDELKRRLIDVWCGLEQSIYDELIDQWRGRLRACVRAKGGRFEYSSSTDRFGGMVVDFRIHLVAVNFCLQQ